MVWQEVLESSNVWVYEYVANGYKVNAFAFVLNGNHLAIISPPIGLSDADFASIDAKGQVTALIAPHSGHDLGHGAWQTRYPNAVSYAPETALKQINQGKLRPFLPLAKLAASQVELREVPDTQKGGTIAIVRRGERPVVYLDEIVSHWTSLPDNWLAKFLFLMAEDIIFLVSGKLPMQGKEAFAAGFQQAIQHYRIQPSGEIKEIHIAEDWRTVGLISQCPSFHDSPVCSDVVFI